MGPCSHMSHRLIEAHKQEIWDRTSTEAATRVGIIQHTMLTRVAHALYTQYIKETITASCFFDEYSLSVL